MTTTIETPLTPPDPAPTAPPVEVILGADVASSIAAAGGDARHVLLVRALHRELGKIWPGRTITVTFDFARPSSLRSDEAPDRVYPVPLSTAIPVLRAVLFDAHRYEWDGKPLATPHEAITHMLNRCQTDADLGYLVGPGAQAFRLLCEAEAGLLGESLSDVLDRRSKSYARAPRQYVTAREHERAQEKRERIQGDRTDGSRG